MGKVDDEIVLPLFSFFGQLLISQQVILDLIEPSLHFLQVTG